MRLLLLLAVALLPTLARAQAGEPVPPEVTPQPALVYDAGQRLAPAFHRSRRDSVRAALPADAVAVFFSAPVRTREDDVEEPYVQDSDLRYLTGTTEPASVLVLAPGGLAIGDTTTTEVLFVPPNSEYAQTWLGPRLGPGRAEDVLGVARALSTARFAEALTPILADTTRRLFRLPPPDGVRAGSPLDRQLRLVETHALGLAAETPVTRPVAHALLTTTDADAFADLQAAVRGTLAADAFGADALRRGYDVFLRAETLQQWQKWRYEHVLKPRTDTRTLRRVLTRLRAIKTAEEMRLLQRAVDLTVEAQTAALRAIAPDVPEHAVEAVIEQTFLAGGAEAPGYPSIVGSGPNTTVLHYVDSRRTMRAGDLVLMDVGAEVQGYTADVTRTVPVDGTFSPEQKAIYDLVLEAQRAGIDAARAGADFQAPHRAAVAVCIRGLMDLGLIATPAQAERFVLHGTSHYLGLYVHDVGDYGPLKAGEVITVEPGLYLRPAPDLDPKWWNIGVRIEDDVRIRPTGPPEVLSADLPKTTADLEAIMGSGE
jgi:Xaa-Pro aminopeptidase